MDNKTNTEIKAMSRDELNTYIEYLCKEKGKCWRNLAECNDAWDWAFASIELEEVKIILGTCVAFRDGTACLLSDVSR